MFSKINTTVFGEPCVVASGIESFDLGATMECGQCFRHQRLAGAKNQAYTASCEGVKAKIRPGADESYVEYMTVIGDKLFFFGQRERGELIAYGVTEEEFEGIVVPYFALDVDYGAIREQIKDSSKSDFINLAAESADGIRILSQDPFEALFSFIVSQNNNIPRIRKILSGICAEYGECTAERQGLSECPLSGEKICSEGCKACGKCFTFPKAEDVVSMPQLLLPSKPGFRYKYLVDCCEKVTRGEVNLEKIKATASYEHTASELKKIKGVGDKVAACAALFGFGNYEAFPVDVWMKRAIDTYFSGKLDIEALGKYRGITQQYIFHYIRNLEADN